MGKILTYLKISEDNQSRDVLDAERLLEGMQAIYASAPTGSKKDNFAIPLAEMTKVFIEKVKGIAPKEQPKEEPKQELNFKVGDKFTQDIGDDGQKEFGINVFTILEIDQQNGKVKIHVKYDIKNNGREKVFERNISKVVEDVDVEWWIPYVDESLPFKVGDKFTKTIDKDGQKEFGINIYTILNIDLSGDTTKEIQVEKYNVVYDTKKIYNKEVETVIELIKSGLWVPYEEEDSFKVGDMFYNVKDGKDKVYQVLNIDGQNFTFVRGNKGKIESYENLYTTDEANAKLKDGKWVKITKEKEQPKEEPKQDDSAIILKGQKWLSKLSDDTFEILKVDKQKVFFKNLTDGKTHDYKLSDVIKRVQRGQWVRVLDEEKEQPKEDEYEFKFVGDEFYNTERDEKFVVSEIYKKTIVIEYEDGEREVFSIDTAKALIKDKYWIKVVDEEKEQPKDQDFPYKVGDRFHVPSLDEYFEITEINSGNVKFTYNKDGRMFNLTKEDFLDRVDVQKTFIPVSKNYKVGDKFLWAKEDITFVIDFIKNGELGIIYSDGLTGFISTEQFEKGLSTGYYKPYIEEAQPKEKKPRKPREPRTKSEQDKKIEHILDINLDEIQF